MRNAVATLLLGIAMSSSAREVFVSPTGDDGAMGTRKAPLRTLAKAVENVQPGDTITVRGGVYREAVLLEGVKGTEGKPVRLQAAKGESVV
ncbi:MAG: DUF1565 domain-containing protein, partial [Victivallales bacterium]|nr:DUF1565 domain-containing protein [Victivallales bacterium]